MRPAIRCILLVAALAAPALSHTIDDFFDGSVLHDISVTIDPADWQSLKDKYLDSTYYRCDLEWRGMTVRNVGIRSRGSGTRNPIKPSFAFDFSKYTSSQRFLGMKSFNTRNFAQDASMMHERLTMLMFARMGLPYLREAHARFFVNGQYAGVYLILEPIDTRFLLTHFGESDGYLYEFQWTGTPYRFEYLGADPGLYVPTLFEPKNNESSPDAEWIQQMVKTVNESSDEGFAGAVGRYLDLESFVAHVAVEQFMAESDGFLGMTGMTNFYYYRRKADDRGLFLIWDKDQTFTNPEWSLWQNTEQNVLLRRALRVPALRKRYLETLAEAARMAGGVGGWLDTERQRITGQIRQAAQEDPVRVCVPSAEIDYCPWPLFDDAVEWVGELTRNRAAFINGELRAAGFDMLAVTLLPGSARNAASGAVLLSPGSLVDISTALNVQGLTVATALPLPKELNGVAVSIGGVAAPLVRVSALGAMVQVPWEIPCGPSSVRISHHGLPGNTIPVEVRPASAGVFTVTHVDGAVVASTNPARPGELLVAWATGLGVAEQPLVSGMPAPLLPSRTKGAVTATIGGLPAIVRWAGFTPGLVGLQQVLIDVPSAIKEPGTYALNLTAYEESGIPYALPVR